MLMVRILLSVYVFFTRYESMRNLFDVCPQKNSISTLMTLETYNFYTMLTQRRIRLFDGE